MGAQAPGCASDPSDVSDDGLKVTTARDVLPPVRRTRRTAPSYSVPVPSVVVVARPDHEAREWADLALASASELEDALKEETAAHAATQERLGQQRIAAMAALKRAEAAEAAVAELRRREAELGQQLERALHDQQALEGAHRALRSELADKHEQITDLHAQVSNGKSALLTYVEQRNKTLEENELLRDRLDALQAQLERIREAAR